MSVCQNTILISGVGFVGTQKKGNLDGYATYFFEDGIEVNMKKVSKLENGLEINNYLIKVTFKANNTN